MRCKYCGSKRVMLVDGMMYKYRCERCRKTWMITGRY